MISTTPTPTFLLSNAVAPSPATVHAGASRGAPQHGGATSPAAAQHGFAQAMKQAVDQRPGKPAAAAAAGAAVEPGGHTDAGPGRKSTGKAGPDREAMEEHPSAATPGAQPPGVPADASASTALQPQPGVAAAAAAAAVTAAQVGAAQRPVPATPEERAVRAAAEPAVSEGGVATTRLHSGPAGLRWAPDAAVAPGQAALNQALSDRAAAQATAPLTASRSGDPGPGGATPLPRPPAAADRSARLATASAADTAVVSSSTVSSSTISSPAPAEPLRQRAAAQVGGREPAADAAAALRAAATEQRPLADPGLAGSGARPDGERRGAEAPPKTALRAGDRGVDRAAPLGAARPAAAASAREAIGSEPQGTAAVLGVAPPASDAPGASAAAFGAVASTELVAAAPGPATATASASGQPSTAVDSPVGSPAFAAEAGYRIAVLVRDGIETAQLQLNPAELGPVTVHIVVEGLTAQVHLTADHAETRQALEASMPQLAGNLRESGLTLTGGGVSEQAPRQQAGAQDGGSDRGARNRPGGDGGSGAGSRDGSGSGDGQRPGPAPRRVSGARGVVDLVA
jgi:hypothetical protein